MIEIITTSEAKHRKGCADAALFHLRAARRALAELSADVADLDSLIEDAEAAGRYYKECWRVIS